MTAPLSTRRDRARDVAVLACALSAGVHAGLAPEHLHESVRLGVSFAIAAALAALAAVALSHWPRSPWPAASAAILLGALIGAYAISRTVGLAPLGAERESLDALGAATQVVEAGGVIAAVWLLTEPKSSAWRVPAERSIRGG